MKTKSSLSIMIGILGTLLLMFLPCSCNQGIGSNPIIYPFAFSANVDNPFFPLVPGRTLNYYVGHLSTALEDISVTTTDDIKTIIRVPCRVVHHVGMAYSKTGMTIAEDTWKWYSQDSDGNVWYFGRDTTRYDETGTPSKEGSWEAGVDGAKPGIVMLAAPALHINKMYREGYLKGVAEDIAQIISVNANASSAFVDYANCVEIAVSSDIEPGVPEHRFYASGVGEVRTEMYGGVDNTEVLFNITNE